MLAFSMQGKNAWEWYCSFRLEEIRSFPYFVKEFPNFWIYGNDEREEVEDAYIWVFLCIELKENFVDVINAFEKNPSNILLHEIKMRNDPYIFSVKYIEERDVEPYPSKQQSNDKPVTISKEILELDI